MGIESTRPTGGLERGVVHYDMSWSIGMAQGQRPVGPIENRRSKATPFAVFFAI